MNYHNIPREYRTNKFLENYNGFIKAQLGKKRIINWINFLNFLKNESKSSIDKLLLNANYNKAFIEKSKKNEEKNAFIIDENKNKQKKIDNIEMNFNIKVMSNTEEIKFEESYKNYLKIGIDNYSNNCFANSVIQILLHCDLFITKFIENIRK